MHFGSENILVFLSDIKQPKKKIWKRGEKNSSEIEEFRYVVTDPFCGVLIEAFYVNCEA